MRNILKSASLLLAAVMLVSCHGNSGDEQGGGTTGGKLEITADKTLIQSNGSDVATLTVTLDGKVLTDGVAYFDGKNNPLDIADGKFSVTAPGVYQVWASYGTSISDKITIRAISIPVPETPADPNPSSTDFKARVLLTQFTGVECPNCPLMMVPLHAVLDKDNGNRVVWVADHSFTTNDPAYTNNRRYGEKYSRNYPSALLDHNTGTYFFSNVTETGLSSLIDQLVTAKSDLAAGIAVNVKLTGRDVVAKVSVKSPANVSYKVGGFLLEDGIYARQASNTPLEDWMNTHDSCIRYIDASHDFHGHALGTIDTGDVVDYVFVWNIDDIWKSNLNLGYWNECVVENLRVAFYVSVLDEYGNYYVNNAVQCKLNTMLPFEYK